MNLIATRRRLLMAASGGISSGVFAFTVATPGKTYATDLSAITASQLKTYSQAISNNIQITNRTQDVYIDDYDNRLFFKLSCGDSTKTFDFRWNQETHTNAYRIIGFNHDTLASSRYYGQATATGKAGITWQITGIPFARRYIKIPATNVGGWESSNIRSVLNECAQTSSYLSAIAPVVKTTSIGNKKSTMVNTTDYLFLLSEVEFAGTTTRTYAGEGTQYMWHTYSHGPGYTWTRYDDWLRSAYKSDTKSYCWTTTYTQGYQIGYDDSDEYYYMYIAFCS